MEDYCRENNIELGFNQPGKPTQNSLIERFIRTFKTEFLSVYLFENLKQMRNHAEIWMWVYNNERPHIALQHLTPKGGGGVEIWKTQTNTDIRVSHIPTKF